jgi:hypothetical protein
MAITRRPLLATLTLLLFLIGATGLALQLSSSEPPAARDYVGQQTCMTANCHADQYLDGKSYMGAAAFKETLHQKIHLRPTPETVIIDRLFREGKTIRFQTKSAISGRDTLLIELSKGAGENDYYAQMKISGGGDSLPKMKIAYTYGGQGWMQRYLVEINDAFYVLPFQYVLRDYKKIEDNTEQWYPIDLDRWMRFDSASGEMKFYEWNSNAFREKAWDKACSSCHVNGFDINKTVRPNGDTLWKALWVGRAERDSALQDINISIGCESCHGPGSEHVATPRKDNILSPARWGTDSAGIMLKRDLCGNCHDRSLSTNRTFKYPYDEANNKPYIPGTPLDSYINSRFGGMTTWVDRFTSYAHHQSGQDLIRSKPFQAHAFKEACSSCHLSHSNKEGLPFQLNQDFYSMTDGVGCVDCHGSKGPTMTPAMEDMTKTEIKDGKTINSHTQHSLEASQCINCHFGRTATIGFFRFEMTSHNFKVVRPIATKDYARSSLTGMMNTCAAECHRNGRANRNIADSTPVAPSFGITDNNPALNFWRDQADLDLADSLWYHYQRMYAKYLTTAVREGNAVGSLAISSISPNPFISQTTIRFNIPRTADVSLDVYDIRGTRLKILTAGRHVAGTYSESWDGSDEFGGQVPAGTYFVRLSVGGKVETKQVVIAR